MFHHNDTANVWFCTLFPLKNREKDETDRFFCTFFKKIRKKVKFWFDIIQTWYIVIAFVVLWRWISTTECAYVAQLVEHFLGKEEVIGSTPIIGSIFFARTPDYFNNPPFFWIFFSFFNLFFLSSKGFISGLCGTDFSKTLKKHYFF